MSSERCESGLSSRGSATPLILFPAVNAADAEIQFRSSDQVVFRIHRKNLETSTAGFNPPENATFDEIVELTEPAATLELLFQFIYPQRYPSLTVDFAVLDTIAEAAEKYQVYSCMALCHIYMRFA